MKLSKLTTGTMKIPLGTIRVVSVSSGVKSSISSRHGDIAAYKLCFLRPTPTRSDYVTSRKFWIFNVA